MKIVFYLSEEIENGTSGPKLIRKKILQRASEKNAAAIADYIGSVQTEINPSDYYKKDVILLLFRFSCGNSDKPFEKIMTRYTNISRPPSKT
jgi:hypothetical protein